jgi:PIN domain nuclease of toxin-antitoxin system
MIRFLLDTNVVLWLSEDNPRINRIKDLIFSGESEVYISAVSWWEMAIKIRIGKLQVDLAELRSLAKNHKFTELPLYGRAAETLNSLPKLHNDPFDHMLLAQAITEPMRLISGDEVLKEYSSSLVMVI